MDQISSQARICCSYQFLVDSVLMESEGSTKECLGCGALEGQHILADSVLTESEGLMQEHLKCGAYKDRHMQDWVQVECSLCPS
jgi:hypothetical protein